MKQEVIYIAKIEWTPLYCTLKSIDFEINWKEYNIPKGFIFDWASIPSIVYWLYDRRYLLPYIIHDFLYSEIIEKLWYETVSRLDADRKLLQDLNKWRILIYFWVRLWGWYSYKKDRNYDKYRKEIDIFLKIE